MKQEIFLELVKSLRSNPSLRRKVKIAAVVGAAGLLIAGGLAVWVGLKTINYVASYANQAIQAPTTQGHVEDLKAEMKSLPKLQPITCWAQAQTLFAAQPWLERPALVNLNNLKAACFEEQIRPSEEQTVSK